jgi:hypothetical protein
MKNEDILVGPGSKVAFLPGEAFGRERRAGSGTSAPWVSFWCSCHTTSCAATCVR